MNAIVLFVALAPMQPSDRVEDLTEPTIKTKIAIMSLSTAGVPEEYGQGLTETIATSADRTGVFQTISPQQIASLLAYEKRKELLGGCVEEKCYLQVARLVRARHLIAGSVARVADKLTLNLVLIDEPQGIAINRVNREMKSPAQLMDEARRSIIVLLQPVLNDRQGYLKVACNVPDASISVDDELRSEKAGQVIALAAGPHIVKIVKNGFYATAADIFVKQGRVTTEDVKLIPAKETIEDYESNADLMRYGAYGTAVLAVGAGVVSGIFYAKATDDKNAVDSYANALAVDRAAIPREDILAREDSFSTNQAFYLSLLGTTIISAGISTYLFLAGDDPDHYEEFHDLSGL